MRKKFAGLLALCLTLTLAAPAASALELEDARQLLREHYVDGVPEAVLELGSLDEILDALDDPYTVYYTPEEYEKFLTSVNGESVVGIGVSVQTIFDGGFQILSILPDSPALEAGLEAGDRIVAVDGVTLTETSDIRSAIGGEEGSQVTITVISLRDGATRDYTLTRRSVDIPIVTYETVGSAGYIDCTSFGESTIATIEEAITELDDEVALWIMDLRSNPGGTSDAAAGSAGLFVGSATMVYFRDAAGNYQYVYTTAACPDLTDKPLIILTSPWSASGSELFAGAARDYGFGIALGQRTFGKGVAQIVFDETNTDGLFDGDALKITAYRFFSPDGATNQTVGVLPTLTLSEENTPAAALLLSAPEPSRASGHLKLELAGLTFYIDLEEARGEDYIAAFTELLEALPPAAVLYEGSGTRTWKETDPAALAEKLELDYAGRTFSDLEGTEFEREIETLAACQLLGGYEDGTFRPEGSVTRAEFCTMVAAALNLSAGESAPAFTDVGAGIWYAGPIAAMAARGFAAGDGDGAFRPDDPISCQEVVTILSAVAAWASMEGWELSQEGLTVNEFAQYIDYADWARTAARNLDELGALAEGLVPGAPATRGQAAGMLCRLMEGIGLIWD